MTTHRDAFLSGVSELHGSEKYTDLTIVCGETKFKVHRAIICSQSKFFRAACENPGFEEGLTGIVTLREDDEACVRAMIEYFYRGSYMLNRIPEFENDADRSKCDHEEENPDHSCLEPTCFLWPFGFTILMWALGDKYDIPGLRKYSCDKLDELNDLDKVRKWGDQFDVWETAYEKSRADCSLRTTVIKQVCTAAFDDRFGKDLRRECQFHSFLERCPELAVELYKEAFDRT